MAISHIDSLDDSRLDPFRSLKPTNVTRWRQRFVVEGDKLTRRLLESDFDVDSILLSRGYAARFPEMVRQDLDVLIVPDEWIEEIVGFNFHRGVLACARRKQPIELAQFCRDASQPLTLVVCPDVQDPENVGSILRSGCALGISALVLGPGSCDPLSRRVLRVSMGAALRLPIIESPDLAGDLAAIRDRSNVDLWATVASAEGVPFDNIQRPRRLALLFGSEGHGLSDQWLRLCSQRITIPMRQGTDSFNVAVAAGILLHHFMR